MQAIEYCDLCGHAVPHRIILKDVKDNLGIVNYPYQIVECEGCKHCHLQPLPSNYNDISKYYPKNYYAFNTNIKISFKDKFKRMLRKRYYRYYSNKSYFNLLFHNIVKNVVNEPPFIENGKICDVGCGNGRYVSELQSYWDNVSGVEPNEAAVKYCISKGLSVCHGFAEEIPYIEKKFDIIRMWNVLEHCLSPKKALMEAARVLKENGYLILYVPNIESIDLKVFGKYWANLEVPRHIHFFRYNDLKMYLQKTGFQIEKILYPGTIYSGYSETIKILLKNKVNIFKIISKVSNALFVKMYNRILGSYRYDSGMTILATKNPSKLNEK